MWGSSTAVFRLGRIHLPYTTHPPTEPDNTHTPGTGAAPWKTGARIRAAVGSGGAGSAEGALGVLGLEERLLHGQGAHALCWAAVPRFARWPRGTRGTGDAGDALLPHGTWRAHLPIAWWSLGTWKAESDEGRWHRADGVIRNVERERELTWGPWWAAVPHQPHPLLPFLSFGTRLPWRRDVNGETPSQGTPQHLRMAGSTYPACLALPAVPLCQSALASLGILGVPAGRAAHPCPGDPVCLGPPPSPPGSASVRCSMPCALRGQTAQTGAGGAPALAPITPLPSNILLISCWMNLLISS